MLRVRIEIVPFGDETKTREIKRLEIFNKGRFFDTEHHEYGVIELDMENNEGAMLDWNVIHKRSEGASRLVERVLFNLGEAYSAFKLPDMRFRNERHT